MPDAMLSARETEAVNVLINIHALFRAFVHIFNGKVDKRYTLKRSKIFLTERFRPIASYAAVGRSRVLITFGRS